VLLTRNWLMSFRSGLFVRRLTQTLNGCPGANACGRGFGHKMLADGAQVVTRIGQHRCGRRVAACSARDVAMFLL
jgi:hypothetical protein